MKDQDPYAMFFTGVFNGHSQLLRQGGGSTAEGNSIEDLATLLGLTQLINEPTNFERNKKSSCIVLVLTNQPNLVLESGTLLSTPNNNSLPFQIYNASFPSL